MIFEKIYRLAQLGVSYKLKTLRPLGPPFQFSIEATNKCNFKCAFCPQSSPTHKDIRPVGNLTAANFYFFLKSIKELKHGNRTVSICLDGEPLMNKAFPDFIEIGNELGMMPRFSSNGKLLTPTVTDRLSKFSFLAAVDFASEPRIFDEIRGREGDFEIVLENLRYLISKAKDNPSIRLEIVDITHFSGEVDDVGSLAKMRALFPRDLPPNIQFWSRKFHNFGGHLKNGSKGNSPNHYKLCPYPWTSFHVTWDGDVVACGRNTEGKTVLGNIYRQTIMDIWRGEKYINMRRALIEERVEDIECCKECDMPYSASSGRWRTKYIFSSLLRR
ncbi:radical SAM protein with 4Fe4S-binding SPASM domain [Geothermobacter ehrlichii]|uniref:Radical SAM protein with 4Fe4S-binding SPASM domain n=1 Tax=Geothermobacter ehrlichii TaxID=213224 RepID=A0A5D3WM40_9BACT|nr:radical SAM/SPASM domain-containing protein [Geothermobacter ehrlichii]TYO98352.1 radical SAM protein with 4Fe4S-binding SPASM domain [Geothermobacter ehrlichii]